MHIRTTQIEELEIIYDLYEKARQTMRQSGNHKQWIHGYPSKALLKADIEKAQSYVMVEREQIVAVFTFFLGTDPTYHDIQGAWLNEEPYGVIHRIGSDGRVKNILSKAVEYVFQFTNNIRIDTHEENKLMQHVLQKNGFVYCGEITIEDGTKRRAYQCIKKEKRNEKPSSPSSQV